MSIKFNKKTCQKCVMRHDIFIKRRRMTILFIQDADKSVLWETAAFMH
jgi:hypothetical protein